MKNSLILLFFVGLVSFGQDTMKTVSGVVTDGRSPMSGVTITVLGTSANTSTDDLGKYRVQVPMGNTLRYSYQGMKAVEIKIEDVTRILNVDMVPDIEELEEVTVTGSNRKSQSELASEYPRNMNLIRTAFGYLNAATAPGNIRFLNEEEINPVAICILDLLRNEFSGVRVQGTCMGAFGRDEGIANELNNLTGRNVNDPGVVGLNPVGTGLSGSLNEGKVFIRGASSLFNPRSAIFDIDGQIINDPPIWLDIKNIKRIAILNNFATTTNYGSAGAGGVIVINTISGTPQSNKIVDQARLRNNFVASNILGSDEVRRNWPTYLQDIYASTTLEEAKTTYQKYAGQYASLPFFTLDIQKYFKEKWNEGEYADGIVEDNSNLWNQNPVLLKALAYQYQEQGEFEKANNLFKKVLKLRPNYAQSYLDLANSYRELRDVKQAAAMYTRYNYLIEQGFMEKDSIGIGAIFEREYNNFLLLEKNALVKGEKAAGLFIADEDFKGTRLVFEWNDSEAEFELQFVNPGGQYTLLKHSLADNAGMIRKEKEYGYNTAEYLIDNALPGTWTINVNYLGNKSLTPTYLKATVYYDYGSYSQRKETKVFKMTLKNAPYELFQMSVGSKLVLR